MANQYQTLTSADGLALYTKTWQPAGTPKANFIIVHGLGEHSGRYEHMASKLVEAGIAVHAADLRGHGQSEGPRGHTPGMAAYVDDIKLLIDSLSPEIPVFLYGHSLGGLIIIFYALEYQDQLNGLVVSAPAIQRHFEVPLIKLILGRIMSSLWPTFTQETGLNPDDLTRLEEVNQAYRDDPLVHSKATARLFTTATDGGPEALLHAGEIHIPTAVIQGGHDLLVVAEASHEFFKRLGSEDKTWIFIPDAYHETHNEADGDKVIQQIADWVLAHL
ncbi:MAG: lysophospholipase [Anaerolineales bacterium]|jgi:alpha-beta hydrolase superfamily lysophospholipase